jgi:hypothetical protein
MASLQDLLVTMQNGVIAIRELTFQLRDSFPPITDSSTRTPPAGTLTFTSSLAAQFGTVSTSSGGTYRIALYPSS